MPAFQLAPCRWCYKDICEVWHMFSVFKKLTNLVMPLILKPFWASLKKIIIIGVMMTDNIDRANSVCQELCPVFYICHRLNPHKSLGGNVIIPVLQIRKLKLREIKWHVQGYIDSKWQRKFELVLLRYHAFYHGTEEPLWSGQDLISCPFGFLHL